MRNLKLISQSVVNDENFVESRTTPNHPNIEIDISTITLVESPDSLVVSIAATALDCGGNINYSGPDYIEPIRFMEFNNRSAGTGPDYAGLINYPGPDYNISTNFNNSL